ncbi:MAG TPA: hypothetical protein VII69_04075 [Candidatus Eremiobacteraceae bacterium]
MLGVLILDACARAPVQVTSTTAPAATAAGSVPMVTGPAPTSPPAMPTIRIADRHGIVSIGRGAVDPKTLHVPLYPGATQSSGIGSFSDSDAHGSTAITTLDANAAFALVDAWYKAHAPAGAQSNRLSVGREITVSYEWVSDDGRADRVVTINTNHGSPIITISQRTTVGP